MAVRNKLTEYREQLGYSQKDVGRSVDTDAGCICRYEREERYHADQRQIERSEDYTHNPRSIHRKPKHLVHASS